MAAIPHAGHSVTVKFYCGSTAMVAEPTTALGGNVYQITDAARRVLDPSVVVTVSVGAITAIDYLFGKITTDSASIPTVGGSFIPEEAVLSSNAMDVAINTSRAVLDRTPFGLTPGDGNRLKLLGLNDFTITFQFHGEADTGSGNIGEWFGSFFEGNVGTVPFVTEVDLGGDLFRAWGVNPTQDITVPIDDLLTFAVTIVIHVRDTANEEASVVDTVAFGHGS